MKIRHETPTDHQQIEKLILQAFNNHPHHKPGTRPTEHRIVNRLRKAGALTLSLVVQDKESIIGHIAFSPIKVNGKDVGWYGLGPVSVMPAYQSQGIGAALIQEAMSQLKQKGIKGVVLLGEPDYYTQFGFNAHPGLTFPGVPEEYFLALPLHGVPACGEVSYHPAFFETESAE